MYTIIITCTNNNKILSHLAKKKKKPNVLKVFSNSNFIQFIHYDPDSKDSWKL